MAATKKNQQTKKGKTKKRKIKKVGLKKSEHRSKVTRKTNVLVRHSKKSPKKNVRKNYSSESVDKALEAVGIGMSIRKAAAAFGIPIATLARKKNHPDEFKTKPGPDTVFSKDIEQQIVDWILYKSERGQPVTKTELLDAVQKYIQMKKLKTPFINNRPGRHWYEGFRKRHSNISIRKPQQLSLTRASVTREDLKEWFDEQEKYLQKKNLLHICPSRIFNCDESSILLCPDGERVLTSKGARAAYKVTDGGKECLTVLFMYSADGTRAPPMLMFAYKEKGQVESFR
ncbi:uncharacterized protein [Prorops nasuta]|uniref:uncharacterized protein n=1 Tax=Prorops nasuta TaxID=863751 RepID=UPI0034CD5228